MILSRSDLSLSIWEGEAPSPTPGKIKRASECPHLEAVVQSAFDMTFDLLLGNSGMMNRTVSSGI